MHSKINVLIVLADIQYEMQVELTQPKIFT